MSPNLRRRLEQLEGRSQAPALLYVFQTRSKDGAQPSDTALNKQIAEAIREGRVRNERDVVRFVTFYEDRLAPPARS